MLTFQFTLYILFSVSPFHHGRSSSSSNSCLVGLLDASLATHAVRTGLFAVLRLPRFFYLHLNDAIHIDFLLNTLVNFLLSFPTPIFQNRADPSRPPFPPEKSVTNSFIWFNRPESTQARGIKWTAQVNIIIPSTLHGTRSIYPLFPFRSFPGYILRFRITAKVP